MELWHFLPNHFVPVLPYFSHTHSTLPLPVPFFNMTAQEDRDLLAAIHVHAYDSAAGTAMEQPGASRPLAAHQAVHKPAEQPARQTAKQTGAMTRGPAKVREKRAADAESNPAAAPQEEQEKSSSLFRGTSLRSRQGSLDAWPGRTSKAQEPQPTRGPILKRQKALMECFKAAATPIIPDQVQPIGTAAAATTEVNGVEDTKHARPDLATAKMSQHAEAQPSHEPYLQVGQVEDAAHQARDASLPLSFLTWNVMGLTTVKEEPTQLVSDHSIFTETKLTERTQIKNWLRHALKDY